jgi:hypothetical protein
MDLAREQANKPNDKKFRRKLWREIAKYLFKTEEGASQGSNYRGLVSKDTLQNLNAPHCDARKEYTVDEALEKLDLKEVPIEDLIELFPNDTRVEHLKSRFSKSLNSYHK